MKKLSILVVICIVIASLLCSCEKAQSATNNAKLFTKSATTTSISENTTNADVNSTTVVDSKKTWAYTTEEAKAAGYTCDIASDSKSFGKIDCVVPDNLYSTTINDWYANYKNYDGQAVEIQGYYITDSSSAYTWIGRNGPSCQYCSNGYVCFEFYSNKDLSKLATDCSDWITVKGILRSSNDGSTDFYYIEAISVEKTPEGQGTITN